MTFAASAFFSSALATTLTLSAAAGHGWDRPFDTAEFIPADVEFFIHVDDPASLRARLEDHALAGTMAEVFGGAAIAAAWRALAESAGLTEEAMFDTLLGRDATFAFRRGDGGAVDWVAVASIDDDAWGSYARRLDLRIGAPIHGVAVLSLPDQEISFARVSPLVIAGPRQKGAGGLLGDSLALLAGAQDDSLARDADLRQAAKLGDGETGVFIRHARPLGGVSAFVADLGREVLVLKHSSRFENAPFGDTPRPTTLSRDLFERLSADAVCVLAQPLEMPAGPLAAFIRARLPEGALTPEVEENLGERLFWIAAERDQPRGDDGGALTPLLDLVIAVEVRDAGLGSAQLDALCDGLARVLVDLAPVEKRVELPVRAIDLDNPDGMRRLEIGAALARLYPRVIDPAAVSLNWMTVDGAARDWWVIGTGDSAVARIGGVLAEPVDLAADHRAVELDWQLGLVRGRAAAEHAQRLGKRLSTLLADQPEDARAVEGMAGAVSSLLEAVDRCIWKAELPGQNRMRSTWFLHFRHESESADEIELRAVDGR